MKQLIAVLLLCVLILTVVMLGAFGADSGARMYVNDEPWYNESMYPMEKYYQDIFYVPVSMFGRLDTVSVEENKTLENLMISRSDGAYMTFDLKTNFVYKSDRTQQYMAVVQKASGEKYVPVQEVCNYFGFRCEIIPLYNAVRISDDTTDKNIFDVIELYNPSLLESSSGDTQTNTETEETSQREEPPNMESIGEREIYLTFEGKLSQETLDILDVLEEYGCKATFFIEGGDMAENAALLMRMMAGGHSIGLHTLTHDEAAYTASLDTLIEEIEAQNALLNIITKKKSRLFRAPNGSYGSTFSIDMEKAERLEQLGYVIWDWNVTLVELRTNTAMMNAVEEGVKIHRTPVIRFIQNSQTVNALPNILEFLTGYSNFTIKPITETTTAINFIID